MKHIKKEIKTFFKKLGQEQENQYFLIEDLWKKTAGPKIYKNTEIIQFKNNTLTVMAKNATWKNELHYLKQKLTKELQKNNKTIKTPIKKLIIQ